MNNCCQYLQPLTMDFIFILYELFKDEKPLSIVANIDKGYSYLFFMNYLRMENIACCTSKLNLVKYMNEICGNTMRRLENNQNFKNS